MKTKSAVRFFYQHAGFSFDPKTETRNQGKWRCAREMARAEKYANAQDWLFEWEDDWSIGNHKEFYGEGSAYDEHEPSTCESCLLRDLDGNVLASLSCIDDADVNYRRVVEAELACEALGTIEDAERKEFGVDQFIAKSFAL